MVEPIQPYRRRFRFGLFRFSLRTMFVVVIVLAIPLGWAAYYLGWAHQRQAFLDEVYRRNALREPATFVLYLGRKGALAPWGLRLFGEEPRGAVVLRYREDEEQDRPQEIWQEIELARSLFPEANVYAVVETPDGKDRLVRPSPTVD